MSGEQRKSRRVPAGGVRVYFGDKRADHLGFVQDLSESGMRIRTRKGYPKDATLKMSVEVPGHGMVPAKGLVKRARKIQPAIPPHAPVEMGIVILEGSKLLKDMILDLLAGFIEKRGVRRKEIQLSAALGTIERLIEEYTQNIGDGGLFVVTESPANLGEIVPVRITLPAPYGKIHAECEVAHVVSSEEASLRGRLPGCGLKFHTFADGDEKKYRVYLNDLRKEDGRG